MRNIFLSITMIAHLTSACGQANKDQDGGSDQSQTSNAPTTSPGAEESQSTGSTDNDSKGLQLAPVIIGVGMLIGVVVDVLIDNNTAVAPEPPSGCTVLGQRILECSALRQRYGSGPAGPQCAFPSAECRRAQTLCSNAAWESLFAAFQAQCMKKVEQSPEMP